MADSTSIKRLVMRLLLMVVVMFAFGFALVPLYDVMCKAFGINGKTAGQYEGAQVVDTFYVKDMFGLKLHSAAKRDGLEKKLRAAIADGAKRAEA